eukprot:GHVT01101712.1.p4 GENE.GHVT01101712.1~~GHVT01101712.1.p4  ORF type:complete len:113 (+),score=12.83 GHVT01101712.1:509-847(+)
MRTLVLNSRGRRSLVSSTPGRPAGHRPSPTSFARKEPRWKTAETSAAVGEGASDVALVVNSARPAKPPSHGLSSIFGRLWSVKASAPRDLQGNPRPDPILPRARVTAAQAFA